MSYDFSRLPLETDFDCDCVSVVYSGWSLKPALQAAIRKPDKCYGIWSGPYLCPLKAGMTEKDADAMINKMRRIYAASIDPDIGNVAELLQEAKKFYDSIGGLGQVLGPRGQLAGTAVSQTP